jgi:hypothetical protein
MRATGFGYDTLSKRKERLWEEKFEAILRFFESTWRLLRKAGIVSGKRHRLRRW